MNEDQARQLAHALGGETWQSGGAMWLVIVRRSDGSLVVFSDDVVCEYVSQDTFDESLAATTIALR
jgi:hypothetical protein